MITFGESKSVSFHESGNDSQVSAEKVLNREKLERNLKVASTLSVS